MARHKVRAETEREASQQLLLAMLALQEGGKLLVDTKISELFAGEDVNLYLETVGSYIEITAEIDKSKNRVNDLKM